MRSASDDSPFSERRLYEYNNNDQLERVTLTSNALFFDIISTFTYSTSWGFVAGKSTTQSNEIGIQELYSYSYDESGNLAEIQEFNDFGALTFRTVYEYEATTEQVVNLVINIWLDSPDLLD